MFSQASSSLSRRAFSSAVSKVLSESTVNPQVVKAEYAVRGEIVIKADKYRQELQRGVKHPFNQIVSCNIGNPQELNQKPITFFRQVLALCHYPALLKDENARKAFAPDAISRAEAYLKAIPGGTGAYSASVGVKIVREEVAQFIEERDGHPCDPDSIFLSDGASSSVKSVLQLLIRDKNDGVLTPIPQYPLYSATLTLLGGQAVGYYLDEANTWALPLESLEEAVKQARQKGINPRALVVINPGNPTGQCLPRKNMEAIVEFCAREGLVLLADEVYQSNIYASTPFTSFKKVVREHKDQNISQGLELISFHSVSKGFLGECGQRGGYMELVNIAEDVRMQLYKLASVSLCSNLTGQLMTGLMCRPPKPQDPSYSLYAQERDTILASLKRRALKVTQTFNTMTGVSCQPVEGALYAFPSISLPKKAVEAAKAAGKQPDTFYALSLLDATGIVVVPGSGFGQKEGTWHFRTTILPGENILDEVMGKLKEFHENFMKQYA